MATNSTGVMIVVTKHENDAILANRERLATMTDVQPVVAPGRRAKHRVSAPDEGRDFERHTIECKGCGWCRPPRGTR